MTLILRNAQASLALRALALISATLCAGVLLLNTANLAAFEDTKPVASGEEIVFDDDTVEPSAPLEAERGLKVVRRVPHGLLARLDGACNVLFLEGSATEMGAAHGALMADAIHAMRDRIYAAGVAASVAKKLDFFAKTDEAIARTRPFAPSRFYAEIHALASASGLTNQEAERLNNFMELFHCSGVAARGTATRDGRVLHVRVLDYARDIGLQEYSTIIVSRPVGYHAWLSVSYAGFVGTVTAMNETGLTIGEMGGGGEGKWDGLAMSFLMRRVVEECSTVDEAIALMKSTPLTCDYYYVLSDAQGEIAAVAAIAESDNPVEVLRAGESHPLLPGAVEDVAYISAGSRAEALYERLKNARGRLDVESFMEIIKRPVAMNSNLHDAIFAPETLDVWRAEAGAATPACDEPYYHINLREALEFYDSERER